MKRSWYIVNLRKVIQSKLSLDLNKFEMLLFVTLCSDLAVGNAKGYKVKFSAYPVSVDVHFPLIYICLSFEKKKNEDVTKMQKNTAGSSLPPSYCASDLRPSNKFQNL